MCLSPPLISDIPISAPSITFGAHMIPLYGLDRERAVIHAKGQRGVALLLLARYRHRWEVQTVTKPSEKIFPLTS